MARKNEYFQSSINELMKILQKRYDITQEWSIKERKIIK